MIPALQLVLFGYAINSDPKRLDAALLALGQDHYTRAIVSALEVSNYYRFTTRPSHADAEAEGADPGRRRRLPWSSCRATSAPASTAPTIRRFPSRPTRPTHRRRATPSARSTRIANRALLREQGKERETASASFSPVIPLSRSSSQASAQFKCTSPNARYRAIPCSQLTYGQSTSRCFLAARA